MTKGRYDGDEFVEIWMHPRDPSRLSELRIATVGSQVQLAQAASISQQYVSGMETGRHGQVSPSIAARIARALGVAVDEIFEEHVAEPVDLATTSTRGSGAS
ncbi:XRE family transcriptional regulator [Nakamurella silvestris]|nr:XRE family transcriptional regulator [Nakamurella silvestris]